MMYYVTWKFSAEETRDHKAGHKVREFYSLTDAERYSEAIAKDREPKILREYPCLDTLEDLVKEIERLRIDALFGGIGAFDSDSLPPVASEYHLLMLAAMDSACRFAMLAHYNNLHGR